jgi:hypothetical protein
VSGRASALILTGVLVAGGLVVWLLRADGPAPGPAPSPPSAGLAKPGPSEIAPLSGDVADRLLPELLGRLLDCQSESRERVCEEDLTLAIFIGVQSGKARLGPVRIDRGWLADPVLLCLNAAAKQIALPVDEKAGQLEVLYPVACGQDGRLRLVMPRSRTRADRVPGSGDHRR